MRKLILVLLIPCLVFQFFTPFSYAAEKKLAQTGFQFLSIPTDARVAAMGEAFTTVPGQSSSMFFNPANMALMNSFVDFSISQNNWIADINQYAGSIAFNPARGLYGTFGISVLSVDYGEFYGTVVDPTLEKGYRNTENFAPSAFAIGFGYAKSLTDRFSVGGQAKYVYQELGSSTLPVGDIKDGVTKSVDNKVDVIAFDFGTIYKTGFKSLVFGMNVRNFSQEVKYQTEGFQLPLTFTIGISMNVFDLFGEGHEMHSLLISMDALHPRAYSERLNFGGEYWFKQMFALRCGYNYNYDERNLSAGLGFQLELGTDRMLQIDYAYTPFGLFGNVQRMSFRFSL
ncbi:MAG: PorV/PorQ family protein [bacterium]|nr:PorV/PorQ family protein [bacterium]